MRMIKRDRNHPSLVIYNLHNERGAWPQVQDYAQMRMAHSLDPTRILTYNPVMERTRKMRRMPVLNCT